MGACSRVTRHMVPQAPQLQSDVRPGRSTRPTSPVRPHVGQIELGSALGLGESVVLDASWSDPDQRDRARMLGASLHADVLEIRCELPEEIAIERLRSRLSAGDDASDATPAIAALMAARNAPWPEAQTVDSREATTALAQAVGLVTAAPVPDSA